MRGYFAIGAEGISKAMNAGAILRTAHAFGASFVFTVGANYRQTDITRSDTSAAAHNIPFYAFGDCGELLLPDQCRLVGVELTDAAIPLPSFRHPRCAAYVFGPERSDLSDSMQARCEFIVRIPTAFCVNISVAAAIVMYDRMLSMGRFAERPVRAGAPTEALPEHVQGGPVLRHLEPWRADPPTGEGR